jgi:lipopolysaccharide assembly outer membrane protein LptD (OstA)
MRVVAAGVTMAAAQPLAAQTKPAPPPSDTTISEVRELINNKDVHYIGKVELKRGDVTIYADDVRVYGDTNRAIATGNVVLSQATSRIAAERADFNTQTNLGTFYNAYGIATLQPGKQPVRPTGGVPPPVVAGQDTDVYFYGDTIEKIGPKKYRISNGGFTACVQPTPRWQLSSSTVVLNLDHYTILHNAIMNVKGVPMMYVPWLYYPTKKDARATGFLLPSYGTSTVRGQSLHNAFFWAIDRSQDLTLMHDWYTSTGNGVGSEYRYNFGAGSDGDVKAYWIDTNGTTTVDSSGTSTTEPGTKSYEVRGTINQMLPYGFRARGNMNYFSDLTTSQTLNTNVYDASRNNRTFGGNVVGVTHGFSINATMDHSETFYSGTDSSAVYGNWPRVSVSRIERPLFGQLYYSVGGEYASLLRTNIVGGVETDSGLSRMDITPQIRYPFKKWQWFTVNSTISWRDTYYTRSKDPEGNIVDVGLDRRYFQFTTGFLGPVFTRIWNTPDNGYAEKFKHTIEPYFNLSRTSSIDNFDQIVQLDGTDTIVGGMTTYNYGVNNRFYAKRHPPANNPLGFAQAREIVDVEITQSAYTDARGAQYDPRYATSFSGASASNYSPIALSVRTLPTDEINATLRAEFDSHYHSLRTISAGGTYSIQSRLVETLAWSKRAFIEGLPGFDDKSQLDQYISSVTNVHTRDNRIGGIYSLNYDLLRSTILQQRLTGFYNAQCCGVSFEYQNYNLSGTSSGISSDRRFFISFTLAGLGNFSPFNGAMGGVPR